MNGIWLKNWNKSQVTLVITKANIPTDWNVDALLQTTKTIHLIEIDSVASDSVYTHVTLNNEICRAKLDTGAQINAMTESLNIGKVNKWPQLPKSEVKLVGYGNRNIEYIGTTVLNVSHLNQEGNFLCNKAQQ